MYSHFDLHRQEALITRASRGLGRAAAEGLAQLGDSVALVGRTFAPEVILRTKAHGVRGRFHEHDLADIDGIPALIERATSQRISISRIAPDRMDTEMNTVLMACATSSKRIKERIPTGRCGWPEDMRGAATHLASPASDYVNGSIIAIDSRWMGR